MVEFFSIKYAFLERVGNDPLFPFEWSKVVSKNLEKNILNIIEKDVNELGYQIAEIFLLRENEELVLRICIDKEVGYISLEDCQKTNAVVDQLIDKEYPNPTWDALQISSPGIERVLNKEFEFKKFAGSPVSIGLYKKIDGEKKFIGNLINKTDVDVTIEIQGVERTFDMKDVAIIKLHAEI